MSGRRRQGTAHYVSALSRPSEFIPSLLPLVAPPGFENMTYEEDLQRYRVLLEELERSENPGPPLPLDENDNNGDNDDDPPSASCLMAVQSDITSRHMPHHHLPLVFPTRPLNALVPASTAMQPEKNWFLRLLGPLLLLFLNSDWATILGF